MRLNQLFEAPLADYDVSSAPDTDMDPKRRSTDWNEDDKRNPEQDSFHRQTDRKMIQHPKTKATLAKYLKLPQYNFYLFFYNDKSTVSPDPEPGTRGKSLRDPEEFYGKVDLSPHGVNHDQFRAWFPYIDMNKIMKAKSDPEGIVVIHRHNDFDGMENGAFPMTPWMILHRTLHALITPSETFLEFERVFARYKDGMIQNQYVDKLPSNPYWRLSDTKFLGTTRTFRDNTIGIMLDQVVEFICQYLVTRKIIVKHPAAEVTPDGKPCNNYFPLDREVLADFLPEHNIESLLAGVDFNVKRFEKDLLVAITDFLRDNDLPGVYVV